MIEVKDLTKHYRVHERQPGLLGSLRSFVKRQYRDVRAVEAISFDIAPGEIVGVLGANGAGKTTTLKMLAGLLKVASDLERQARGAAPTGAEDDPLHHRLIVEHVNDWRKQGRP